MIYLASYEPGSGPENRETEHRRGRQLLRFGLETEYGRTWETGGGDGVKPFLREAPGICFNISHTRGLVVCAVSSREVGVDVEEIRPFRESLMRRVCSPEEQVFVADGCYGHDGQAGAICCRHYENSGEPICLTRESQERFFRLWTLKESFVKTIGQGLKFPLRDITFSWEQDNKIKGSIHGYVFYQSVVYGKYIISVCEAERKQEGERI